MGITNGWFKRAIWKVLWLIDNRMVNMLTRPGSSGTTKSVSSRTSRSNLSPLAEERDDELVQRLLPPLARLRVAYTHTHGRG